MMRRSISALVLTGVLAFGAGRAAMAQPGAIPPAAVPTTHILAIGSVVPGAEKADGSMTSNW